MLVKQQGEVNDLQKDKISQLENTLVSKPLFAEVAGAKVKTVEFPVHKNSQQIDSAVLLVKSDVGDAKDVINNIKSKINPTELNICINKIKPIRNGMLVSCANKDVQKIKSILADNLGKNYTVSEGTMRKPRIKIVGIDLKYAVKDTFVTNMFKQNE
nr:unnamed protein product [Callosobruchus analis]